MRYEPLKFGRSVTVALFTGLIMGACAGVSSPTEPSPATSVPAAIAAPGPTAVSPATPTPKPVAEVTAPPATGIAPAATPSPTPVAVGTTPARATPEATAPKAPPGPPEPVSRGLTLSPVEVDGLVVDVSPFDENVAKATPGTSLLVQRRAQMPFVEPSGFHQ